ncbi:MAG: hypothetical protein LW857_02135 [Verrucomicrobiae bacterium]|nr:hypothetical protein [Verrucomicrobiae bacterium]
MADARSIALACATEASLWADIQGRAQIVGQAEPALLPMLKRYVLDRPTFAEGIVRRLSERIAPTGSDIDSLAAAMQQAVAADPERSIPWCRSFGTKASTPSRCIAWPTPSGSPVAANSPRISSR